MFRQDERFGHHRGDGPGISFTFRGAVERFGEGDVHMHRTRNRQKGGTDRLVDHPATLPLCEFVIGRSRQLDATPHVQGEHTMLTDRLSFPLVHQFFRAVRSDQKQWGPLVESLRNGGSVVQDRTS